VHDRIIEGMVAITDSDEVPRHARVWWSCLLGNHPLDCPVCDAGGECELQDMTFSYGAAESKYMEPKNHKEEQQWSPWCTLTAALHPLLSLCAGVRRGHGRVGTGSAEPWCGVDLSPPNKEDHLECEELRACVSNICPVGA